MNNSKTLKIFRKEYDALVYFKTTRKPKMFVPLKITRDGSSDLRVCDKNDLNPNSNSDKKRIFNNVRKSRILCEDCMFHY